MHITSYWNLLLLVSLVTVGLGLWVGLLWAGVGFFGWFVVLWGFFGWLGWLVCFGIFSTLGGFSLGLFFPLGCFGGVGRNNLRTIW